MERVAIILFLLIFVSATVKIQRWPADKESRSERNEERNENFPIGSQNSVLSEPQPATDKERNVEQLIESRGFVPESHFVITEDGYNLTVHRIINPLRVVSEGDERKVVLLQHPLLGSSADFLINSEGGGINDSRSNGVVGNNLGFELAYLGYDVWLGNSRGNVYGSGHIFLKPTDHEFWDFSFDDMIKYDLTTTINYVRRVTNSSTIGYVGHSQGSLLMFGLLATHPEYNDLIKPFIAMAPVSHISNIKSPIKLIARNPFLMEFLKRKGGSFLKNDEWLKKMSQFCPRHFIRELCESVTFLFCGPDSRQFNATRFPVYVSHTPSGTSLMNVVHFGQLVNSGKMSFYDYGKKGNKQKYGSKQPPEYLIEKITNKNMALISSLNDWLADPQDVDVLRSKLKVKLIDDYVIPDKHWNHLDFIWAIDTGKYVNSKIISLLHKYM